MEPKTDFTLDAKGLACPMPIVKTKKTIKNLESGQVLEIQATDKGSKADLKAWAKSAGHQYLGTIEDNDVLKHYIRKEASDEEKQERQHPNVISNEKLENVRAEDDSLILDVRESAEYAFKHIPEAISIPLGELEDRTEELDRTKNIYIVCHTGNRSDMASQRLAEKGFENVYNVVPGMKEWSGETTSINQSFLQK